ncbi:hypothetical protein CEXT_647151 [Caerostris extrusa]|uniref:Uncharacterized protein n=1 Tax=Caerostris extrusa TaxID=172846 RepID=A0AAV4RA81_CAEEX|nr:hypothetical protein CEXT_647151 [Caerostris extrusa]
MWTKRSGSCFLDKVDLDRTWGSSLDKPSNGLELNVNGISSILARCACPAGFYSPWQARQAANFHADCSLPRQRRTQQRNAAAIRAKNSLNWDFLIRFQFRVYSVEQNSAIILTLIQTFPNRRRTLNEAKGNCWSVPSSS